MAIEATSIFLSDVRSAVGDDKFAKFLNLNSENSMALVIDISGSMSGEPLFCSVVFYDYDYDDYYYYYYNNNVINNP